MIVVSLALLAGCRQDMHNQPKYKPLRETVYYPDMRSARPLVVGTVARGQLRLEPGFYTGLDKDQHAVTTLPFPLTRKVLERGRERFNIYCSPCHAETGDANGLIVQRGYLRPPSLHEDRLRNAPLGHFVDVMTNGLGGMPDYSQQVSPEDRWNIAAYIRALQLGQSATLADVPDDQRQNLGKPLLPPEQMIHGKTGVSGMEPSKPLQDGKP